MRRGPCGGGAPPLTGPNAAYASAGQFGEAPTGEIVRDLQSVLNEFTAIARSLGGEVDVPEAEVE
ncbi:hypothetical protein [Streptomyces yerevanensis]|uniref:hypothetical protein n=1 Tax=Streptomyces yerevanensis TaxID=66378 RepID=UPI0005267A58|nr:hypothetical protein [Streptomyces yerevanensis]